MNTQNIGNTTFNNFVSFAKKKFSNAKTFCLDKLSPFSAYLTSTSNSTYASQTPINNSLPQHIKTTFPMNATSKTVGQASIVLKQGDITKQDVDIIVNAANSSILGGGGVDGAIHNAAGPSVLQECMKIRATQQRRGEELGCPTGQAVITSAGQLKAKHIIHVVGPNMNSNPSPPNGDELLRSGYKNVLRLAAQYQAKSIAIPSISTGIYGFPIEQAARIALETCADFLESQNTTLREINFILFSQQDLKVYQTALSKISTRV